MKRYIKSDIHHSDQHYTSSRTSINSTKLPAIYKLVQFEPGMVVLDYGGGKFDNAVEALAEQDVELLVYDPFNRSESHNSQVISRLNEVGGADAVVCSNVLNVIEEPEIRKEVLENIDELRKSGASVYITVYEGNKTAFGAPTKSGYQLNRPTADYIAEIEEVFNNVYRKGKLIVCK